MTIIDSPGLVDIVPQSAGKQIIDNEVYQWFIDRSDVIYIVIDVSQLHLSSSLRLLLDQLKGSFLGRNSSKKFFSIFLTWGSGKKNKFLNLRTLLIYLHF